MTDRYRPSTTELLLVVPSSDRLGIASSSAIVAERRGDFLHCHYEGALYSRMNWHEKLCHAAGRLVERYPTVAQVAARPDDVIIVGTALWDDSVQAWTIGTLEDGAALEAWTGEALSPGPTDEMRRVADARMRSRRWQLA